MLRVGMLKKIRGKTRQVNLLVYLMTARPIEIQGAGGFRVYFRLSVK